LIMKTKEDYINDLSEIRAIMERSSRFISLSGLSGVLAGTYALVASFFAYRIVYVNTSIFSYRKTYLLETDTLTQLLTLAAITFVLSVATGILLTTRKAKQDGLRIWEEGTKRLLVNLLIPLLAGGLFILALINRSHYDIVASASLLFYGLALINAAKYTVSDVRYLGMSEILIGLRAAFFPGYGLIFW